MERDENGVLKWTQTFICWSVWAWANGGVDEWEYEMDDDGIRGRKIVRKAGRMKFLRGLAWIAQLLPAKPSQKMAALPVRCLAFCHGI